MVIISSVTSLNVALETSRVHLLNSLPSTWIFLYSKTSRPALEFIMPSSVIVGIEAAWV